MFKPPDPPPDIERADEERVKRWVRVERGMDELLTMTRRSLADTKAIRQGVEEVRQKIQDGSFPITSRRDDYE